MRAQTACCLTVRFAWDVAEGEGHPSYTFTCVEDREMATTAARHAAARAPSTIRFVGAEVSATGGKAGDWDRLDLEPAATDRTRAAGSATADKACCFDDLADITARLAKLGSEIASLAVLRQALVRDLHDNGYSHGWIAEAAGLSRGRIFQILKRSREGGR